MTQYDWLIRQGRVIDPASGMDSIHDIAIQNGRIAAVAQSIDEESATQVYDASGRLVTPGLIDLHVHAYHLVTPLGIEPDHYFLGRGVTTVVDAGSAGCDTFPGLNAFVIQRCRTRILAFLHISRAGLCFAGLGGDSNVPGELESLRLANARDCARCIDAHRDVLVGVKIRLSHSIANEGHNEHTAYDRAREAAAAVKVPLMVHHNLSTVSMDDCPGAMIPGDIYTHVYHGFHNCIIQPATRRLEPAVQAARDRGVLFDVGHGQGSFNWTVAELATAAEFWPDTISSDLHSGNCEGPVYDLPTVMSRLLYVGMPLVEVIRSTTISAAKAIGWQDRIGTLGVGRDADVTVLSLEKVDMSLEDSQSQMRQIHQRLIPVAVWRGGQSAEISSPMCFPNRKTIESQRSWWPRLAVRDEAL